MKLSRNTALWVGGVTPLAALMILLTFLLFKQGEEAVARQRHTDMVLSVAEAFMSGIKDAETGARGYLLTGDEAYLEPYLAVRHKLAGQLAQLRQLTQDNAAQQRRLEVLIPLVDERLALLQQSISSRRDKNAEGALKSIRAGEDNKLMDSIRSGMSDFTGLERGLLTQRDAALDAALGQLRVLMTVLSAFIAVLSLVSAFVVYRETSNRLQIQEKTARELENAHEALRAEEEAQSVGRKQLERDRASLDARGDVLSAGLEDMENERLSLKAREDTLSVRLAELERDRVSLDARDHDLNGRLEALASDRASLSAREDGLSAGLKALESTRISLRDSEVQLSERFRQLEGVRVTLLERENELSAKRQELDNERAAFLNREAGLSAMLDLVGDAVFCVDAGGRITYMNACAGVLAGWTGVEAIGQPVVDIVRIVERQSGTSSLISSAHKQDANLALLIARDGSERIITERRAMLSNAEGESTGEAWILHDVTAEYAAALHESAMQVEAANVVSGRQNGKLSSPRPSNALESAEHIRVEHGHQANHQANLINSNEAVTANEGAESSDLQVMAESAASKSLASVFAAIERAAQDGNMTDSQRVALADIFSRLERP